MDFDAIEESDRKWVFAPLMALTKSWPENRPHYPGGSFPKNCFANVRNRDRLTNDPFGGSAW